MSASEIRTWQLRARFAAALSSGYTLEWMAAAIGHHTFDPFTLYDATAQEPSA